MVLQISDSPAQSNSADNSAASSLSEVSSSHLLSPSSVTNDHNMITRGKSRISKTKVYSTMHSLSETLQAKQSPALPTCYSQAIKHHKWKVVLHDEHQALQDAGTYSIVPPHPSQNVVGCKWVFRVKHKPDGTIDRFKAKLVAKGNHQQEGLDYT